MPVNERRASKVGEGHTQALKDKAKKERSGCASAEF